MNLVPCISTLARGLSISLSLPVPETSLPTPFSSPSKATKVHSLCLRFPHHGPSPPPWVRSRAPWHRFQTLWDLALASFSDLRQLPLFSLATPASNFTTTVPQVSPASGLSTGWNPSPNLYHPENFSSALCFPAAFKDLAVELGHLRVPIGP